MSRLERRTTPLSATERFSGSIKTQLFLLQEISNHYASAYHQLNEQLRRPPGYLDLALALDRNIPQSFLKGQRALAELKPYDRLHQETIETLNRASLYDRPIKGVMGSFLLTKKSLSLAEMEQLPLPLSEENRQRMLAYFLNASLSRDKDVSFMGGLVGLFAIQSRLSGLSSEEAQVDTTLKNLHWRLVYFFDSLTEFLVEFPPDETSEEAFLQLVGSAAISPMLGAYLLVRQGLTPASLVKLFLERKRQLVPTTGLLGWPQKIMVQRSFDAFIREIQKAGLAAERSPAFNQETDTKTQELLLAFYQPDEKSEEKQIEVALKAEELLTRVSLYRKRVTGKKREVGPEKVEFSGNNFITEVEYIFKRSGVLTLLLLFETDRPCSLVVEIDKDNRVFGLPPGLAADYPNFKVIFLADILPQILERLKEKFPEIERPAVTRKSSPTEALLLEKRQISPPPPLPRTREPKKTEKRRNYPIKTTPLEIFAGKKPSSELPLVESAGQKKVIIYSRKKVERQLGKTNTETIDRIMKALKRLEQGNGDIEKLKGFNLYSLRVGRYRVLLEFVGENSFRIFQVGRRDTVYSGLMPRQDE